MVNKRVRNAILGCNLKNDRIISVHFQSKPFNITVIQVYAPTSNAEETEQFYEDLQDLLELTPKKDILFIIRSDQISRSVMSDSLQPVPNMLLEISGEITPERMKGWSQSKKSTQPWM